MRHLAFAPITLSHMFNVGEIWAVGITTKVKAQLSQLYPYSTLRQVACKCKNQWLSRKEWNSSLLYILINCDDVEPFRM